MNTKLIVFRAKSAKSPATPCIYTRSLGKTPRVLAFFPHRRVFRTSPRRFSFLPYFFFFFCSLPPLRACSVARLLLEKRVETINAHNIEENHATRLRCIFTELNLYRKFARIVGKTRVLFIVGFERGGNYARCTEDINRNCRRT